MEEKEKLESEASVDKENEKGKDESRGHHSHSHHKHRSHHKKHRSSKKKSGLDKMQDWVEQKFSAKTILVASVVLLLVAVLLIGLIYLAESNMPKKNQTGGNQDGYHSNGITNEDETLTATVTVPAYWDAMLAEKTKKVKGLQTDGGMDCVSFVWASDPHIPDNSTARTNDLGKLMAKMLNDCEIPFAVLTGDIGTRHSVDTETELLESQKMISVHLAPLWNTDRLLVALGNHDGAYGDASGYYQKQFTPEKLWQTYFRGQAMDFRRVFSEDGLYYYVDNPVQKTRFIILNSQFAGEYKTDGNGNAVNNRFSVSCYGQEQLEWLANVALDMPEGYGAVITTHVPPRILLSTQTKPYTVDSSQICGIINAYNNKTTFTGSYTDGVDGWSNSKISVDFTKAKGEIIAMFAGHIHQDTVDLTTLSCPLITILAAGAPVNEGENPERNFGTDTETSFDVVTINRQTRTIHCTRVGSGEDRVIPY